MIDRRINPANERVAASYLRGQINTKLFLDGLLRQCLRGVTDLLDKPSGRRVTQLSLGEELTVFEQKNGFAFVQSAKDDYCGYMDETLIAPRSKKSHWVSALSSHLYPEADLKKKNIGELYFCDEVEVINEDTGWSELRGGVFVPSCHLSKLTERFTSFIKVAELFLNSPYLWGGCSRSGIDCSGLIQIALISCGIKCPRDADMQEDDLGYNVSVGDATTGDLIFWKGHVGILTEPNVLTHANAHHMAVFREDLDLANKRIEKSGGGTITSVKRL
ncbi:MAG: hypothetical protein ACI8Y9_001483 [Paracoccaceae bacterium]